MKHRLCSKSKRSRECPCLSCTPWWITLYKRYGLYFQATASVEAHNLFIIEVATERKEAVNGCNVIALFPDLRFVGICHEMAPRYNPGVQIWTISACFRRHTTGIEEKHGEAFIAEGSTLHPLSEGIKSKKPCVDRRRCSPVRGTCCWYFEPRIASYLDCGDRTKPAVVGLCAMIQQDLPGIPRRSF